MRAECGVDPSGTFHTKYIHNRGVSLSCREGVGLQREQVRKPFGLAPAVYTTLVGSQVNPNACRAPTGSVLLPSARLLYRWQISRVSNGQLASDPSMRLSRNEIVGPDLPYTSEVDLHSRLPD